MTAKIGIISLGCDKNRVDTEVMLGYLVSAGYEIVNEESLADVLIVNTCAFIAPARKESEDTISHLQKIAEKTNAKIIVTGCYPQKFLQSLRQKFEYVSAFVGTNQYDKISSVVENVLKESSFTKTEKTKTISTVSGRIITTLPHYAYLKIADGCSNSCTYCLIPSIRGSYISCPMEELVEEAKALAESGVKELILVAQDVTSYHLDISGKIEIVELLRKLSKIEKIQWLRLMYCYPEKITDELIDEIATNPKVTKYLDMPLQHVSTNVLRLMGRQSSCENICELIHKLRQKIPNLAIRTTLMVGFVNESQEDFDLMCDFVKSNMLTNIGFFAFSAEEGTAAKRLIENISETEKQNRLNKIAYIQKQVVAKNAKKLIKKTLEVIVDEYVQDLENEYVYQGRSFLSAPKADGVVFFTSNRQLSPGEIVKVFVTGYEQYDLLGYITN